MGASVLVSPIWMGGGTGKGSTNFSIGLCLWIRRRRYGMTGFYYPAHYIHHLSILVENPEPLSSGRNIMTSATISLGRCSTTEWSVAAVTGWMPQASMRLKRRNLIWPAGN